MATSLHRPSWFDVANCRSTDAYLVDVFYPSKTDALNGGAVKIAKAFCAPCPARSECLEYALAHNENWGIWGGTTLDERLAIKRERRRNRRKAAW